MRCITITFLNTLSLLQPTLSSPHPPPAQCAPGTPPSPIHPIPTTCLDSSILPPSAWHPWTHRPHCIPAFKTPWCVFTSAASPSAHGISIITTPDEASRTLNPLLHAFELPFFAPDKLIQPRPYEVRDIPGKGKGVIATQRIGKGRAVLVDYASILAAAEYPADVMRAEVQELLGVAVGQLREPERVEELAKRGGRSGQGGEDGEEEGMSEMEDVMLTNSFAVVVGGKEYMGLFGDLARFNHACKPNAFMHFSEKTLAMTVWSARDIEPGEEITISYSAVGLTSKERQESLEQIWGFNCRCSICTAPPEALKESDAHRAQIRVLQGEVVELAQKGEFHEAVEAAERLFNLVEQEGLAEQMGGMYEVPARLYYHIGNLDKALEYTLKVRHEIDGYGEPDTTGEESIKVLDGVIGQLEQEIKEKNEQEADGKRTDQGEDL